MKLSAVRRRGAAFLAAALLLSACASKPAPPPQMPPAVPRGVIESFCGMLHGQGMTSEVRVVKSTQPIITAVSLQALADRTFSSSRNHFSEDVMNAGPLPVEIPSSGSCIGRVIDTFDPVRNADVMLLQLSVPFPNPFAGGQPGVLARLSLANEAATWYWIPIGERNGRWIAGPPVSLSQR